jgi:hypothetical protein
VPFFSFDFFVQQLRCSKCNSGNLCVNLGIVELIVFTKTIDYTHRDFEINEIFDFFWVVFLLRPFIPEHPSFNSPFVQAACPTDYEMARQNVALKESQEPLLVEKTQVTYRSAIFVVIPIFMGYGALFSLQTRVEDKFDQDNMSWSKGEWFRVPGPRECL